MNPPSIPGLFAVDRAITVRSSVVGFHRWTGATGERAYLSFRHRHRFGIAVTVNITHDDREIEFHDLQDHVAHLFDPEAEFGDWSCEMIARAVAVQCAQRWPGRAWAITVDEDGDCSATLAFLHDIDTKE